MKKTRIRFGAACGALTLVLAGALTGAQAATPGPELEIKTSPACALYGEPFGLRVTGLKPGEKATIRAASRDARGVLWESRADFQADASGVIDVARQAPVSGSYSEADIFGLLWTLQPVLRDPEAKKPGGYRDDEVNGWTVDYSVTDPSGRTASTRFRCVYQRPGQALVRIPLEQDGLVGFLYTPDKGAPFPGVIILGGSNGGLYEWLARAFASNGFAALTLAYFKYPNLPPELVEIPLEYFDRAAAWMKAQPQVKPGCLGLAGGSKGGELALILASRSNDYQAVVAWTPAAHAWEGMTMRFFAPDYQPVSSWSVGGKPLPFIPFGATPEEKAQEMKGELKSFVPMHKKALARADQATLDAAEIPAERIKAPLLLITGTDDQTWPSGEFCAAIVDKLKKAGFPYELKHVINEGGGHQSFLPYFITVGRSGSISGGSPRADARAGYRSWAETMAFLHRHLDK
jgi:dienelactone hydrolase